VTRYGLDVGGDGKEGGGEDMGCILVLCIKSLQTKVFFQGRCRTIGLYCEKRKEAGRGEVRLFL